MRNLFHLLAIVIIILPAKYTGAQNAGINATGDSPNASAGLDVDFGNKGLLIPRVPLASSSDASTIAAPATSLLVYNTGTGGLTPAGYYYNSGSSAAPVWVQLITSATPTTSWSLSGNAGTNASTNFLGTSDFKSVRFRTNNVQRMIIDSLGNVGIGTEGAWAPLHIHEGTDLNLHFRPMAGLTGIAARDDANFLNVPLHIDASEFRLMAGDVGIGTAPGSKLDVKGTLRLSGSTSGYVGLQPAAAAGSTTYTLPSADGSSGQMLSTNGTGTLSWATGGVPSGYMILGTTSTAPSGYTYTGNYFTNATGADVWATKSGMSGTRYALGLGAPGNGKIYAVGGPGNSTLNEEFDPATNTWTTKASMPTGREGLAVACPGNGKLYAFGGMGPGLLATNEEYNPTTNTWATKASMPTARQAMAAACPGNGKIYVIGGDNGSTNVGTNEEYDPVANTWATKATMTTPRQALTAASTGNGKIYVLGGVMNSGSPSYTDKNEEYDVSTNAWTTKTVMPSTKRYYLASAAPGNGKIYAIGGYNNSTYLTNMDEYDVSTNTWVSKSGMPTGRYSLAAASTGFGKIYVVGGWGSGGAKSNCEEYTSSVNYYSHMKN